MDGLLRSLRQPGAGRPSLLARLVAGLVVLGMLGAAAPVLAVVVGPVIRWLGEVLL
ncbi:hypothetical protein SAMN06264364_102214 [Quadrisphaera granulorum]|uniref:Uncharacterized protein n=1 Tax=Quadrisphaera granulorum TaxID=317664 RepID=A0A316B017_9ACTN|nr:hypothetical protein [Quadrisphaera granulorum]PWJ55847.1 hypothetical protein BXY45_102214 [Quadrisphaera granulorum]SZE95344.1 hypothetical protein SAMN06264364_102214 [Quadrisphaera granulorum]